MAVRKDPLTERTGYSRFWHLRFLELLLYGPLIGAILAAIGMMIEYSKGYVDLYVFLLSIGLVVFLGVIIIKIYINDFLKQYKEVLKRLYDDELPEKDMEFLANPIVNPKIGVVFGYSVLLWIALIVMSWVVF
ncbi:MAG: hypothetical protein ACFFD4_34280 [Candidatus Odinarchaeota archaeon]